MENGIRINYEKRDGRMFLDLETMDGQPIDYTEMLNILIGALSMAIRMSGEQGSEMEGKIFRSVIETLEDEFIDPDSYKDLEITR
jgi:hypothetical protein